MALAYKAEGWQRYKMSWHDPHRQLEPLDREIEVVDQALQTLVRANVLPHARYDRQKMMAHRSAVQERFDM